MILDSARVLQADALTTGGFAASQLNKAGDWQKAAIGRRELLLTSY